MRSMVGYSTSLSSIPEDGEQIVNAAYLMFSDME